ncbi:fimbrial biogenesis chaperone [Citrobacter rodentium]|jgi:P pilus assembly protein, chaperone PapD|uniref:Fimbrial chaperone protein n=2 Tax=Citrobacter rodentium TaxID=67825 RepID=D2TMX9_CITRI|nr:molecular chaperone [Citrobacter rodentium]KIQ49167.1 sigma-fimbriae chaperone protein [Citrobacter rodentium]QBY28481.1 molecular chaperone [Citrobacter rodentium]UHO29646.1 molecular chaperone [Citrobacter rodentium NBRC 105723 = DSM 16636]CBG88688.1 putative fimbrial chaperone protein [Citrobacter rodentium ICC168]HAT8014945.1 molecular chaperone [Citrobacter rodentium NBRC 105723 = DSM 16636]
MNLRASWLLSGFVTALLSSGANGAATILLWPIDPWLAADSNATELWIQNQGTTPTTMQVRIVRWQQENGFERYTSQQDVVASPPIVRIEKGNKQLIRLIKQSTVPHGVEQAYRIIVDEIPQPGSQNKPQMGLNVQMRYSLPLFVYGEGVKTWAQEEHHAQVNPSQLRWRVVRNEGQPQLEVRNDGDIHVRLSKVSLRQGGAQHAMAEGLLGYVLPGSVRRWPLPTGATRPDQLTAAINAQDGKWLSGPAN